MSKGESPVLLVTVDNDFNVRVQMPESLSDDALSDIATVVLLYIAERAAKTPMPSTPPPLVYLNHG